MAAPATHYVKSDDVHIAYQVLGNGPLDLAFVPGFVSHVEASWHVPERSAFLQRMHDVQTILEEVGSERAVLFGASEGGPKLMGATSCLQSALRPSSYIVLETAG